MGLARPSQGTDIAPGMADRMLAKLAKHEQTLREKIENSLCRLPAYLRYRNAAMFGLLRQVAVTIRGNDLDCLVTGGMAYDALRGQFSRVHHDIDVMFPASQRPAVLEAFKSAGFEMEDKSPYHARACAEGELHVDLFSWVDAGREAMEHIMAGILVRVPRAFFAARQTAYLYGLRLSLPGNDLLKCIRPFVEAPRDRRFLAELATSPLIKYEHRREVVVRRITLAVHEFELPADPRTADDTFKY